MYALSGTSPGGAWAGDIGVDGDARPIPSFVGAAVTYQAAQEPFATGIGDGWSKFGKCAATALLGTAKTQTLKNLEMAEVWLEMRDRLSKKGYQHKYEIGSCEQCRRYLGRMLCEVGT